MDKIKRWRVGSKIEVKILPGIKDKSIKKQQCVVFICTKWMGLNGEFLQSCKEKMPFKSNDKSRSINNSDTFAVQHDAW